MPVRFMGLDGQKIKGFRDEVKGCFSDGKMASIKDWINRRTHCMFMMTAERARRKGGIMKTKKQAGFELIAVIPKTKTDCTIHRELGSYETLEAATGAAKEKVFLPEIARIDIWQGNTMVGRVYSKQRRTV